MNNYKNECLCIIADELNEILNDLEFDYLSAKTIIDNDITCADKLRDYYIDCRCWDIEIIYHFKAIRYLLEHDPSLTESLDLACELGYTIDNVNSEILASILATQEREQDFANAADDIDEKLEEFWNKYEEDEE